MTSGFRLDYEATFVIAGDYEEWFGKMAYDEGWLQIAERKVLSGFRHGQQLHRSTVPVTQTSPCRGSSASREMLFAKEGDLRTLQGVFAACRVFAQSPDPIDPAALAVLALTGSPAVDQLLALWRALLDADP